jgi:hypothetical protein
MGSKSLTPFLSFENSASTALSGPHVAQVQTCHARQSNLAVSPVGQVTLRFKLTCIDERYNSRGDKVILFIFSLFISLVNYPCYYHCDLFPLRASNGQNRIIDIEVLVSRHGSAPGWLRARCRAKVTLLSACREILDQSQSGRPWSHCSPPASMSPPISPHLADGRLAVALSRLDCPARDLRHEGQLLRDWLPSNLLRKNLPPVGRSPASRPETESPNTGPPDASQPIVVCCRSSRPQPKQRSGGRGRKDQ